MSKQVTSIHVCDFCNTPISEEDNSALIAEKLQRKYHLRHIPVLFDTEQNEGLSCEPYWNVIPMPDLCPECVKKVFPMIMSGANGYAEAYIQDEKLTEKPVHLSELGY